MTREELFDILRPIVMTVTGVPECILENPNAPAPNGEYAAINPQVNVGKRGQAEIIRTPGAAEDTQRVEVRPKIRATVWVNFYRGDSRTRAAMLHDCNKRPDISARLFRANMGWISTDPVNDLTALQSENFESRAQIAIEVWYETSTEYTQNSIERFTVTHENEEGDRLNTIDVDIDNPPG